MSSEKRNLRKCPWWRNAKNLLKLQIWRRQTYKHVGWRRRESGSDVAGTSSLATNQAELAAHPRTQLPSQWQHYCTYKGKARPLSPFPVGAFELGGFVVVVRCGAFLQRSPSTLPWIRRFFPFLASVVCPLWWCPSRPPAGPDWSRPACFVVRRIPSTLRAPPLLQFDFLLRRRVVLSLPSCANANSARVPLAATRARIILMRFALCLTARLVLFMFYLRRFTWDSVIFFRRMSRMYEESYRLWRCVAFLFFC